jgi:broad specificity phosphatase PhoE
MTQFYIVRHGNTFGPGDIPTRVGARTDIPLVISGRKQANLLGEYFAKNKIIFSAVFVSPLCRAIETIELIMTHQSSRPSLETLDILTEIDHGPDENQSEDDVVNRVGAEALKAWDESATPVPGWIVRHDERVKGWRDFFARQLVERPNDAILLVTSNGAARFALKSTNALEHAATSLDTLKLRTGSYGRIDFLTTGQIDLVSWNVRPSLAQ